MGVVQFPLTQPVGSLFLAGMKRISIWFLILAFTVSLAQAQETATQQQIDKLTGQIQDLLETQERQNQRINELERKITDLTEKINTPVVNDSVTHKELKELGEQMQEIDRKRQEDKELILQQIEKLTKIVAVAPSQVTTSSHPRRNPPENNESTPPVPQVGHQYKVQEGDNLGLIIKAYRAQGVKVTKSQIIAANPKINPDVLIPGQVLFIPDPAAK